MADGEVEPGLARLLADQRMTEHQGAGAREPPQPLRTRAGDAGGAAVADVDAASKAGSADDLALRADREVLLSVAVEVTVDLAPVPARHGHPRMSLRHGDGSGAGLLRRFAVWLGLLAEPRSKCPVRAPGPVSSSPPPAHIPLPAHRSPYGLEVPLDGTATVAVRPYLVVHEQRQRRRELAMAALGLDIPGPYWIHGVEVA